MKVGASTLTHTQTLFAYVGSVTPICMTDGAPHPHPGYRAALTRVEPEDLARFEGEGGLAAPEPVMPLSPEPRSS
jgi:hypothetical protein